MRVGRSLRQKLWFDCARNQYLQNVRSELQDNSQLINLEIQGVFPGPLLPNSSLGPPGVILKVWVISMEMTWTSSSRHSSGAGEWSWRLSPLLSAECHVSFWILAQSQNPGQVLGQVWLRSFRTGLIFLSHHLFLHAFSSQSVSEGWGILWLFMKDAHLHNFPTMSIPSGVLGEQMHRVSFGPCLLREYEFDLSWMRALTETIINKKSLSPTCSKVESPAKHKPMAVLMSIPSPILPSCKSFMVIQPLCLAVGVGWTCPKPELVFCQVGMMERGWWRLNFSGFLFFRSLVTSSILTRFVVARPNVTLGMADWLLSLLLYPTLNHIWAMSSLWTDCISCLLFLIAWEQKWQCAHFESSP